MPDLPKHQPADLEDDYVAKPATPAWLATEPCPPSYTGYHPSDGHPEDRAHISRPLDVPVIVKAEFRDGRDGREAAVPAEYVVTMRRCAGASETWDCIGDIAAESARRLVAVAAKLVGQAFA